MRSARRKKERKKEKIHSRRGRGRWKGPTQDVPEEWASRSVRTSFPCASNGSRLPLSPCETDDQVSRLKTTRPVRNDESPSARAATWRSLLNAKTRPCIDPVPKFFRAFSTLPYAPSIAHVTSIRSPRVRQSTAAITGLIKLSGALYRAPKYFRPSNYGSGNARGRGHRRRF